MIWLFHGEDELTRSEELLRHRASLGDPTVASLNTTVLDGRSLCQSDLVGACAAMPFMALKRVVIVEDFWSRFESAEGGKGKGRAPKVSEADQKLMAAIKETLRTLPETTDLFFSESRALKPSNPVFAALPKEPGKVETRQFTLPRPRQLAGWIEARTKSKGGTITSQAAEELGRLVGGELRQLDQELDKLLAFVNYARDVGMGDVHSVVSANQPDDIFALVDAIGMRQKPRAMQALHSLLNAGAAPQYILSMIERQIRILLQIKEMKANGVSPADIQQALSIWHSWVMEKNTSQAQNFTQSALLRFYSRLADVEQETKTGVMDERLALDLLVTELAA